jgi:hypothetical protein
MNVIDLTARRKQRDEQREMLKRAEVEMQAFVAEILGQFMRELDKLCELTVSAKT